MKLFAPDAATKHITSRHVRGAAMTLVEDDEDDNDAGRTGTKVRVSESLDTQGDTKTSFRIKNRAPAAIQVRP